MSRSIASAPTTAFQEHAELKGTVAQKLQNCGEILLREGFPVYLNIDFVEVSERPLQH
jgi:hypothetical protein